MAGELPTMTSSVSQANRGTGMLQSLIKAVFDYANLKPVSVLGFSVQMECTKPLPSRYYGDKIHPTWL